MLKDFIALFFPRACSACGKALHKNENTICLQCLYHLPKTNFHLQPQNPVERLFWGRVNIVSASSFFFFHKGGKVQRLIHNLKYRGLTEIGTVLGRHYGRELKNSASFSSAEIIVPVPLHPGKKHKRGYNQSEIFAAGVSETMKTPLLSDVLFRAAASETQTRKSRFARWENVGEIFKVASSEKLEGKHVLLVDDVVTTGSTLEACAKKILEVPGTKVSAAAIACTAH